METDLGARNAPGGRTLGMVLDGLTLREHPMRVFERGDRHNIPIILGVTRDEAKLWTALGRFGAIRHRICVDRRHGKLCGREAWGGLICRLSRALSGRHVRSLRERFLSDAIYIVPAWRTAMAHARAGGKGFLL